MGVIRDNVTEAVKPPRAADREKEILQPDQVRELLDRLRGHPLHMLAVLALHTGARRNELLALRWQDIDLDAGRLRIETALEQTSAYGIRVKAPKTKKGRRTIALPVSAVEALRAHWRAQQEQRLAFGMGKAPADSPVLATFDGKPQSPAAITKAWSRAMDAIGMPRAGLHGLRHTHASLLIAAYLDRRQSTSTFRGCKRASARLPLGNLVDRHFRVDAAERAGLRHRLVAIVAEHARAARVLHHRRRRQDRLRHRQPLHARGDIHGLPEIVLSLVQVHGETGTFVDADLEQ